MALRSSVLSSRRFQQLMPHRVREVLLVSSPFDAFILEEDGLLTERLFLEFMDISVPSAPRFTHAPTAEAALEALAKRRYDLILSLASLPDMEVAEFARRVKDSRPGRPVVLLSLDRQEAMELARDIDRTLVEGVFLWSGDAKILLAIIKYVEDLENVDHDIEQADVRVLLVLEDSPRFYSSYLGMLYKELMKLSRSLYSEGINELHRQMYIKSRPKVLHAVTFEQGLELFERYRKNVLAVISDFGVPRNGLVDHDAGLDFARHVKEYDSDLPVLMQSSDRSLALAAATVGASFVHKASPTLLADIRLFLEVSLGFGEFVFRDAEGREIDRAVDLRDLEKKLQTVADESLVYHATRHHFSIWLMARSEFLLAERLGRRKLSDFTSVESLRKYLVDALQILHRSVHRGVVSDFRREHFAHDPFSRLGRGSLGGKARGMAFLHRQLARTPREAFAGLHVSLPRTVVVTTDYFEKFVSTHGLDRLAREAVSDRQVADRFLAAPLEPELADELEFIAEHFQRPIAVRSSSLLEDSLHSRLAGIYSTFMLANAAEDVRVRARRLETAVKLVWASTYFANARAYLDSTGQLIEEERMAVIIQGLVGRQRNGRFYPTFSGVAQSINFYPIAPLKAEEGVVHLALGLGRTIVNGGLALRFSPRHPGIPPQLASPRLAWETTQRGFYAVDLDASTASSETELRGSVAYYDLAEAEKDGTLAMIGSVISRDDDQIRDDLSLPGPRVVSFHNILKHRSIPFPEAIEALLRLSEEGLGTPVEIEFACDLGNLDDAVTRKPRLFVLQVRTFASRAAPSGESRRRFAEDDVLIQSSRALGLGLDTSIHDLVYVPPERWDPAATKRMAGEVAQLTAPLREARRPFLLMGPGRWGTADPWLGIPVDWTQIAGVRVIVEASPADYRVEPSQGAHFFHNITAQGIGYITLPPGAERRPGRQDYVDWQWLGKQPAAVETAHLRHLRLAEPLTVMIDGQHQRAVIAKPGASSIEGETAPANHRVPE